MRDTRSLLDFAVEAVSHLAAAMPANHLGTHEAPVAKGSARRGKPAGSFSPSGLFAAAVQRPAVTFAELIDLDVALA